MDEDRQLIVRIIARFRYDGDFRLAFVRYAVWAAVAIILLATVVLSVIVWQSSAMLADRLAGIGAIFAGMTLLLTLFAALVAYVAFSVSILGPKLKLQVRFGPSRTNLPAVTAERKNGRLEAKDSAHTEVAICFRNEAGSPAKDPAVIVQLEGMEFAPDVPSLNAAGWTINARSETGVRAVQWDAGAAYSVYMGFVRELPVLNLTGLRTIPGWTGQIELVGLRQFRWVGKTPPAPVIVISILDAISRTVNILPVDFIVNGKSQFPQEEEPPEWT